LLFVGKQFDLESFEHVGSTEEGSICSVQKDLKTEVIKIKKYIFKL